MAHNRGFKATVLAFDHPVSRRMVCRGSDSLTTDQEKEHSDKLRFKLCPLIGGQDSWSAKTRDLVVVERT